MPKQMPHSTPKQKKFLTFFSTNVQLLAGQAGVLLPPTSHPILPHQHLGLYIIITLTV